MADNVQNDAQKVTKRPTPDVDLPAGFSGDIRIESAATIHADSARWDFTRQTLDAVEFKLSNLKLTTEDFSRFGSEDASGDESSGASAAYESARKTLKRLACEGSRVMSDVTDPLMAVAHAVEANEKPCWAMNAISSIQLQAIVSSNRVTSILTALTRAIKKNGPKGPLKIDATTLEPPVIGHR